MCRQSLLEEETALAEPGPGCAVGGNRLRSKKYGAIEPAADGPAVPVVCTGGVAWFSLAA